MALEETTAVPVRVEKPSQRPKRDVREKICSTCGRVFSLTAEQKFFDCPSCYQKKMALLRPINSGDTKVLTQIQCASCGATEFVRFVPEDPKSVLCRPCFAKQPREPKIDK